MNIFFTIIVVFIVLFFIDLKLALESTNLYGKCDKKLKEIEKNNPSFFKKLDQLYGKEMDEIGNNRAMWSFPYSLYLNTKHLIRLSYFRDRFFENE